MEIKLTTLFRLQLEGMNTYLSKMNQLTSQKLKVELYPNTGIMVSEDELNLAISKSNYKHRELVRQLLSLILTDEELIAFKTAEKMNKNNPNIRNGIIGYLKHKFDSSLTTVEFNDIVRRKIEQTVFNQKPKDEIQKIKMKNLERAQKSRSKRKLQQDISESSKIKKASTDTPLTPALTVSEDNLVEDDQIPEQNAKKELTSSTELSYIRNINSTTNIPVQEETNEVNGHQQEDSQVSIDNVNLSAPSLPNDTSSRPPSK